MKTKSGLYLGKQAHVPKSTDLKFEKYLNLAALPPLPAKVGHANRMPTPRLMLGNGPDDSVKKGFQGAGDCVFAMICNAVRLATAIGGAPARFTGKEAIAAYSAVTGYIIGKDSTDNGTNLRTALDWWRKTGIKDADGKVHKLGAYAAINYKSPNLQQVLEALYLLDAGVALGIQFPTSATDQFGADQPWDVVKGSKIEGGHAILLDAQFKVETWGRDQVATVPFLQTYTDEAYALFLPEMLVGGKSIEGFDTAALTADLSALTA